MENSRGVSGSKEYQIERLPKFNITYEALIKKHYRKNIKALRQFEELIETFIEENLKANPCSDSISDPEPFPANTCEQGFDFRKKRWRRLPGLQGAARFGRLLFLVCHPQKIVYLIWIYTHAEFQEPKSRPADKDLKTEIVLAKQQASSKSDESVDEQQLVIKLETQNDT